MSEKRINLISICCAAVLVGAFFFWQFHAKPSDPRVDIGIAGAAVSPDDARSLSIPADISAEMQKDLFSGDIINVHTLGYFQFLQTKFSQQKTVKEHLDAVREYLLSIMDRGEAEKLYALYEKFLNYQLAFEKGSFAGKKPENTEEALELLSGIQNERRDVFGAEAADKLFGAEVKVQEYMIRRNGVVRDPDLYAAEKIEKLKEINDRMWGDDSEADALNTDVDNGFTRYQEDLVIHTKDLASLDETGKKEAVTALRAKYFSPDVVAEMGSIDAKYAPLLEQAKKADAQ